ncbi:MAG: hypothetical protein L6W00_14250 [Lentisphaeria bacterium]|nr:MAG: hypothetical protein L6W00_14250 [Lentisphaeria bacterium]
MMANPLAATRIFEYSCSGTDSTMSTLPSRSTRNTARCGRRSQITSPSRIPSPAGLAYLWVKGFCHGDHGAELAATIMLSPCFRQLSMKSRVRIRFVRMIPFG